MTEELEQQSQQATGGLKALQNKEQELYYREFERQ
jgi:hypothetical protein